MVEGQIVHDALLRLFSGSQALIIKRLVLQAPEEPFGWRVIKAVDVEGMESNRSFDLNRFGYLA